MASDYEVKVTIGNATVEVRGARDGVVAIVEALSTILRQGQTAESSGAQVPRTTEAARKSPRIVDAKSFFTEKSPSSQAEAVVVAAYYLAELAPEDMKSQSVSKTQVQQVFRQAKFPLPKRIDQVLVNTMHAGYLVRVGTGEYKLSPVGWNLVEHTLGSNV